MTLTCSYSPGLVEPRSPASSESVPREPRSPPTLRSPGCRVRFRVAGLQSPVGEAAVAAAASAGGPARGVSLLALAPTSGRGTAAGRELSAAEAAALRRQDAAVRRFGAPYWSRGLAPPAMLPPWGAWNSLLCAAPESGFLFPLLTSRSLGSHTRTYFLS